MKWLLKFLIVFSVLTFVLTIGWDAFFVGRIYFCTDSIPFGYLAPGDWVHGSIEVVDSIASGRERDMSLADAMIAGWSVGRLWMVWALLFVGSLLVSVILSCFSWGFSGGGNRPQETHLKSDKASADSG